MKKCSKCNIEKNILLFNKGKSNKDGLQNYCKACSSLHGKKYKVKYNKQNKQLISSNQKEYRKINKEIFIIKDKEKYQNNRENILIQKKAYYKENKKYITSKNNARTKIRRKADPAFRLRESISTSINTALHNNNNSNKDGISCFEYLNYTIQELKDHLKNLFEPWMTWNNYGKYNSKIWDNNDQSTWTWNIDHIVPRSYFNYISMKEQSFKDCWALINLRPYSAKQNNLDGNRRNK